MTSITSYIAVDPGGSTGWAQFAPFGYLARCGLARCGLAREPFSKIPTGDPLLIIEKPHGGAGKASRVDVATLARRMQMVIDHLRHATPDIRVIEYTPRRWKGTIDGDIMTRRIRNDWMTDAEREILNGIRARKNHNVIDAVGLGVYYAAVLGLRNLEAAVEFARTDCPIPSHEVCSCPRVCRGR